MGISKIHQNKKGMPISHHKISQSKQTNLTIWNSENSNEKYLIVIKVKFFFKIIIPQGNQNVYMNFFPILKDF